MTDPVDEEIDKFRRAVRELFDSGGFDDLEKNSAQLRAEEPLFPNGNWKITEFYRAFAPQDEESEAVWQRHERTHQNWVARQPNSVTALIAYADFLAAYARHVRGAGPAAIIPQERWKISAERVNEALTQLGVAQGLPEKDPYFWVVGLRIAQGQSWPRMRYNRLVSDAHAAWPRFWVYDTVRAEALLPGPSGGPGVWENFAEQTSARPDGLGVELYARIVMALHGAYGNIFRESKASWSETRAGLALLRQKYPSTQTFSNASALLATLAEDRVLAADMFAHLGDKYMPAVWGTPERFVRARRWARTGEGFAGIPPLRRN